MVIIIHFSVFRGGVIQVLIMVGRGDGDINYDRGGREIRRVKKMEMMMIRQQQPPEI